jgi:hypothetical protein
MLAGMADRDLANHDAALAAKIQVIPDLDVRLAYIDTEALEDKYHVIQGLKDTTAGGNPKCCYCYQRWGGTGTRGEIKLDGPMLQTNVAMAIAKVFQERTGAEWGSLKPGDPALPGKYWLQQQSSPDLAAKWEYYVSDGVDGKRTGWYPYASAASDEVEDIYAQHVANKSESRTSTRCVSSGHFKYAIDLTEMKQKNTRTGKIRTIRRVSGREEGSHQLPMREDMKVKAMKSVRVSIAMKKPTRAALKVMKAMKAKVKSTVGRKWQVLKSNKLKTKGGMRAGDLMKNKKGKVVSAKKSALGQKVYEKNLQAWVTACTKARKELGLTGFVAVKKGSEFYTRAKALMCSA